MFYLILIISFVLSLLFLKSVINQWKVGDFIILKNNKIIKDTILFRFNAIIIMTSLLTFFGYVFTTIFLGMIILIIIFLLLDLINY